MDLSKRVATEVLRANTHGIMYGVGAKRIETLPISSIATLFTWPSREVTTYRMHTINPMVTHALGQKENSFLIIFRYLDNEADKEKPEPQPWGMDLDISEIRWQPAYGDHDTDDID